LGLYYSVSAILLFVTTAIALAAASILAAEYAKKRDLRYLAQSAYLAYVNAVCVASFLAGVFRPSAFALDSIADPLYAISAAGRLFAFIALPLLVRAHFPTRLSRRALLLFAVIPVAVVPLFLFAPFRSETARAFWFRATCFIPAIYALAAAVAYTRRVPRRLMKGSLDLLFIFLSGGLLSLFYPAILVLDVLLIPFGDVPDAWQINPYFALATNAGYLAASFGSRRLIPREAMAPYLESTARFSRRARDGTGMSCLSRDPAGASFPGLTGREADIARLLSEGRAYRDIAGTLGIAPSTVKTHALKVYKKLGINGKAGLSAFL
jgi:DNA-binding CsgD family transcriptional regulator